MTNVTTNMGLKKAVDSDNARTYLQDTVNGLPASLDVLDVHDHSGSTKGVRIGAFTASQAAGDTFYASSATVIARLAKGTAYQGLRMNSGATAPEWAMGLTKIAEASGAAASYDFTSIPQDGRNLKLVVYARTDDASLSQFLQYRTNNVSTATYYSQYLASAAGTPSSAESLGATSARIGSIPGATASAVLMGAVEIVIPHYTQANKEKLAFSYGGVALGLTSGTLSTAQFIGLQDSATQITRVTLFPAAGSFTADSLACLYLY